MQALRQMGGGVMIAIVSLLLVIGGISLSLSETAATPVPPTPTPLPPTLLPPVLFAPTWTATYTIEVPTLQVLPSLTPTTIPPTFCPIPGGWFRIIVGPNDTLYTLAERYKTTTGQLSAANCLTTLNLVAGSQIYVPPVPTVTVIPCGPPAGWVRTHVVQAGDTLFRIAQSYGITYPQLQLANCMGNSTAIYTGQRLWVPNLPTRIPVVTATRTTVFYTPAWTATPSFTSPPPTATSTFMATSSPVPPSPTSSFTPQPTSTLAPTSTFMPTATITFLP